MLSSQPAGYCCNLQATLNEHFASSKSAAHVHKSCTGRSQSLKLCIMLDSLEDDPLELIRFKLLSSESHGLGT